MCIGGMIESHRFVFSQDEYGVQCNGCSQVSRALELAVGPFSAGTQRLLCDDDIAQLVADPGLLFLDEPTSGLDSTASKLVIAALQQVTILCLPIDCSGLGLGLFLAHTGIAS